MKKILVIIFLASFLFINLVLAQGYKISVSLPGASKGTEVRDPSEYIGILFKAGLAIAGVLALIFLLYGAILYTISSSRGNVEGEAEAKERIYSVFLGLGLLLLSYLILYTINPDLVKLKMPRMKVSPDIQTSQPHSSQAQAKSCVEKALEGECKAVCQDVRDFILSNMEPKQSTLKSLVNKCKKCLNRECPNQ